MRKIAKNGLSNCKTACVLGPKWQKNRQKMEKNSEKWPISIAKRPAYWVKSIKNSQKLPFPIVKNGLLD